MFPASRIAFGLLLLAAGQAAAQNVATAPSPPPATVTPPPPVVTPVPPTILPAPTENAAVPQNVTAATPAPAPPPPPVEINPDAAYPNGFADPVDPTATNLQDARGESRFSWGLLGLLGLLGLIPLFRRSGRVSRTVYVDRDDPKRVLREERVEE